MSRPNDPIGRLLGNRYQIEGLIGRGASARVYVATDQQLERPVAVKVLHEGLADDQKFLRRFRAEALAAAKLNHPNVMHVYDSGTASVAGADLPYLVCEYLGGGSLRAMLDAGGRLSPSQALVIGLETARGLDYAHGQGFVHRDIKPANLLFGTDSRLRIADFGLARALAEATWTEPQGLLMGTARYTSPEQAKGLPVDGRSDIYSLGLVLIEAVTGTAPFRAETAAATLMARTAADVVVPAELGRLRTVLERCGRLDPEERPDAGELEIAFLAASEDMDRPAALPLAGVTIAPEAVDLRGDGEPVVSAVEGDDVTVVLPSAPSQLDPTVVDLPVVDLPVESTGAGEGGPGVAEDLAPTDPMGLDEADADDEAEAPRRRRWPKVLLGLVMLAGLGAAGWFGWQAIKVPSHPVPTLVGLSRKEADALVKAQKWRVDDSQRVRRDGTEPDQVVAQRPAKGTMLEEGKTVRLVVSLGNTLVALPDVVTKPEAEAIAALEQVGLVASVTERPNDEVVPKGVVIGVSADVDAEKMLPRGSAVGLSVSEGPVPRTIPAGLVNQPIDAVAAQLANLKLGLERTDEFSETVEAGLVLRLDPAEGAVVPRDTVVKVVVSKGPQPIPIPDVTDKSGLEATTILTNAGFPVSGIVSSDGQPGSPTRPVIATDPPAGELHTRGTAVRIVTRK